MSVMQPVLEFPLFIFAIFSAFYLPGVFLCKKLRLSVPFPATLFFPFVLGMLLFTLTAYIFSWLHIGKLLLPALLLVDFFAAKSKSFLPMFFDKKHLSAISLVVFLSFLFSLSMLLAGNYGDKTIIRRDDYWHLALINEMTAHFPPDNPGFAGVPLRGYHFFFNFLLAQLGKAYFITPFSLYFHLFPVFLALLWGVGVYSLVVAWSESKTAALWAVFLTMFGGSFSFILRLQGYPGLSMDDAFGMTQPASSLVNPPFSISIIFMITALYALFYYLKTRMLGWVIPLMLSAGLVSMFKVYAGIILIGGLLCLSLLELVQKKYVLFLGFIGAMILFFATYWIFAANAGTLIWAPLWAPHKVLVDNLPWYGYIEKQYTYSKLSVIKGLVEIEVYALSVFILGSLGSRLIGLFFLPYLLLKTRRIFSHFAFGLFFMALLSLGIPLFFIQSVKVFETIQFTWYFLFFCSLFASLGVMLLLKFIYSKVVKVVLCMLIIFITLPSAYEKYAGYASLPFLSHASPQFQAMQFLHSQGNYDSTVLEIPDKTVVASDKDILAWYYGSSPKIVAFANKRSYFNSEYIDFANLDRAARISSLQNILLLSRTSPDSSEFLKMKRSVENIFKEYNIKYIYSPYPISLPDKLPFVQKIFQKDEVVVYAVFDDKNL